MLKVLLVEDNLIDAKQVLVMLARQGGDQIHATHVERLSTALRCLSRESFDVIMMNSTLVDTHGMDALNLVQAALARLPIVMLSDKSDESVEHVMIQSGVQEVLVKSQWTGDQLARAIRHAVERKRAEQHLSYMAQYDPLTALANRTLFHDRATQAISRAKRKKQEVGIILLGLDRFKEINTELGRDQGDALLKATAERLQKCMREVDTVARLGGVEFTVLLEGITCQADVEIVAKRIIAADFEHDVVLFEPGQAPDHSEDVLVDQKVLAELLPCGSPAHGKENAAVALASRRVTRMAILWRREENDPREGLARAPALPGCRA